MSTDETFTLKEVVLILDNSHLAHDRLPGFLESDPRLAEQVRQLQQLSAEAGVDGLTAGHLFDEHLDALLEADNWEHPAEILDPDSSGSVVGFDEMLRLARARISRAKGREKKRLERVAEKIEAGYAQELDFEHQAERLRKLPRPVALRLVQPLRELMADLYPPRDF